MGKLIKNKPISRLPAFFMMQISNSRIIARKISGETGGFFSFLVWLRYNYGYKYYVKNFVFSTCRYTRDIEVQDIGALFNSGNQI